MKSKYTISLTYIFLFTFNFIYLTVVAQPTNEIQKIVSSDIASWDNFAYSVSIYGDYAIAGAYKDDDNGSSSGSAYIFYNNSGTWEETKLLAADGEAGDWFGISVDISGNYTIVGAPYDDDNGSNSGSAYIFYNNSGTWTQMAKLTASDGSNDDWFGRSVAIFGDYAIIGAYQDDDNGNNSGSAYIFYNNSGTWAQQAKLTASDGTSEDEFGRSVSISENYAIIGAWKDSDNGMNKGSAYIFYKNSGIWTQITKLADPNVAFGGNYGNSVDICGDYAVVGAYGDNDNGSYSGSAYIFYNNSGTWSQNTKLTASDGTTDDFFGYSVSISGNYLIIGAHNDYGNGNGEYSGSAYIFSNYSGVWTQNSKLTASDGTAGDRFGLPVSIHNEYAFIGARLDDENGTYSGSAYIFSPPIPSITNQPNPQIDICPGENAVFSIVGENIDTYQWQVSTDQGGIWSNLDDDGTYSGTTTNTLSITTEVSLNNFQYQCYLANTYGNTTSVAVTLTFETEEPSITSTHEDKNLGDGIICDIILPDYTSDITATDNCDVSIDITQNPTAGTTISGVINQVTLTATDDVGNFDEVSFNVTVEDNTNPVISSTHNDQSVDADANCEAGLPDYTSDVTATDNCDTNLDVTQSPTAGTIISGTTNQVTLTVTDDAGNTDDVTFNVDVDDNTDPAITSTHNDQSIDADANCEASLQDYTGDVAATDNCDSNPDITQNPMAGTVITEGANIVTLTVTDDAGNTDEVTFNVAVEDNTNPVITSTHNDQTIDADANCEAILPDYTGDVMASDNCDTDIDVSQTPTTGTMISGSANLITLTVTDDDGNNDQVTFNVEVIDNTNPVIVCVNDQTVTADETHYYTVQGTEFDPTETFDNCEVASVENDFNNTATLENAQLPEGTTTIAWTITDDAGNTNTCSFDITVNEYVAIESLQQKGILIYPNPSNGILNFEFTNNNIQKITVTNITGEQIIEKRVINQKEKIDLSGYAIGMYVISIQTDEEVYTAKIIKR